MTFRGHLAGGMAAGVAAAAAASGLGLTGPGEYGTWCGVAGTGVLFSLVPDLDTASVPQRWFFKGVFVLILYLACRASTRRPPWWHSPPCCRCSTTIGGGPTAG